MTKKKTEKKLPQPINYGLSKIKMLNYFENDYEVYGLLPKDLAKCDVNLNVGLDIKPEDESINFKIKAVFCKVIKKEKKDLFGIETMHSFRCQNFKKSFPQKEKDSYRIPDQFMNELFGISLAGTRGIMFASSSNPVYKTMLLPLVDTKKILTQIRNKKSNPET